MKLSVIMSTFNNGNFVSQAIASILNQSFKDLEFIIVNDGSSDNTAQIIKKYMEEDKRIVLIEQENAGLTRSLIAATKVAKGEYLARQDADDISLPQRLKKQVEFLDQHKEYGLVGSSVEIMDWDGSFLNFIKIRNNAEKNRALLKKKNIFCHGSMMFRKRLLDMISGYRDFFCFAQDYDLYLRLIEITLPGVIEDILYRRRISPEGISIENCRQQTAYAELAKRCHKERLRQKNDFLLLRKDCLVLSGNSCYFDFIGYFMKALQYLKQNDAKSARRIIKGKILPFSFKKSRIYYLLFFSYLPGFLRGAIFSAKNYLRKSSISLK